MKLRHVFSTVDLAAAETAVHALRSAGIPEDDISLVANHDIENEHIAEDWQKTNDDFARGGVKGLAAGGGTGLVAGLVAMVVPPLGLTLAGAAAMTLVGAAVGGWVGMLTGTSEPDIVRDKFEEEIAAGHVLVVIDGEEAELAKADKTLLALDASPLPFESPAVLS